MAEAIDLSSSSTDPDDRLDMRRTRHSDWERMRASESLRTVSPIYQLVDKDTFQAFMAGVIGLNTLAIAAETDHPDWPVWGFFDTVFLIIFLGELALRIGRRGLSAFLHSKKDFFWNILDTFIVLLGVVDLWLAPLIMYVVRISEDGKSQMSGGSSIMRFLRLLRLLRLLRVFKMVRRLAAFLEALTTMLGPFFLVIFVLFGFNLFVSIALTQVLGHNELEGAQGRDEIHTAFRDVQTSFFSLFQVITMDNWFTIVKPVVETSKMWCFFFIVFMVFCSWTMISILTAVASDNVIAATSGSKERERVEKEKKTKEFYRLLRQMFEAGDEDGNGLLDKEEFEEMLEKEQLNELLITMDINVKKEELYEMWDMLDVAGTGVLTIDEFLDGLGYLQEDQIMTRHIANLDFGIRRLSIDLEVRFHSLTRKIRDLRKQNQSLLDALQQEERVQQSQAQALVLWVQWAVKKDVSCFPTELQDIAFREAEKAPPLPPGGIERQGSLRQQAAAKD